MYSDIYKIIFKRQNYLNGVKTKTAVQKSLLDLGHRLKKKKKEKNQ